MARSMLVNSGNDTLYGGYDSEAVSGGAGNDRLYGRAGNDTLTGGTGNDTLSGEAGNDTYEFNAGDGQDVITGSTSGGSDVLALGAGILPGDITVTQADSGNEIGRAHV